MTISSESPETSKTPTPQTPASTNGQTGTHPIFAVPIDDGVHTATAGLDKVVFGVTAVIALGFLVWGFVSTATLASASGSRAGLDHGQHGLAVRADRVRVRGVRAVAGARQVRQHPARLRRRGARVPDHLVGGDDVQRRHGHRPDVLRCRRAAHPLRYAASWARVHPGNPDAVQTAMATTLFHWTLHPWAIYAVVGLAIAYGVYRRGRMQLISSAFEPLLGRPRKRHRAARSSTCWRSSPRCSVRRPRSGSARCRFAAACTSSPASARPATRCSSSSSRC